MYVVLTADKERKNYSLVLDRLRGNIITVCGRSSRSSSGGGGT